MGRAPSARFSLFSQARAFSSDATIESSERNSRTKSAPSSHSFLWGSSRYFSANILETVGSLTPRVAATRQSRALRLGQRRVDAVREAPALSDAGRLRGGVEPALVQVVRQHARELRLARGVDEDLRALQAYRVADARDAGIVEHQPVEPHVRVEDQAEPGQQITSSGALPFSTNTIAFCPKMRPTVTALAR